MQYNMQNDSIKTLYNRSKYKKVWREILTVEGKVRKQSKK